MECRELSDILSDYMDGELSEAQCAEIQEHIKACPHCRGFVETFRKSLELAHELERKPVPQSVCELVMRAFREVQTTEED